MTGPRPRTRVYTKQQSNGRWHVFCQYPGAAPCLLLSAPTQDEAETYCRGYAARYCWRYERDETC